MREPAENASSEKNDAFTLADYGSAKIMHHLRDTHYMHAVNKASCLKLLFRMDCQSPWTDSCYWWLLEQHNNENT